MNQYKIEYTDEAIQDLRDIYEYISFALNQPSIAKAHTKRIREEIQKLNFLPLRYKTVDWEPWAAYGLRQMLVGHYVVFYLVKDEKQIIRIMRIMYGRRNFPEEFNVQ